MSPAFPSVRHTFVFGLLLIVCLILPMLLHAVGGVSLEETYRGISERAGAFEHMRKEIFTDRSPADIVFCGSSLMRNAIDPKLAEAELSRALGRPAKVVMLPQSWQGPDLNYYVARDLVERRKTGMLVLSAPAFVHRSAQPHVQLFRVIRYGDHPGALDGLGLRPRLAIYAEYVLGGPRQALNLVRANPDVPPTSIRMDGTRRGYMGTTFVERPAVDPELDGQTMIAAGRENPRFRFDGPLLNHYQLHFLRKSVELGVLHHIPVVMLHLPSPAELGQDFTPWQRNTAELFGGNTTLAGISSADLFRRIPADQRIDYFMDEHMNANGQKLFTKAILPALVKVYERFR
jgi:hypothetical protein